MVIETGNESITVSQFVGHEKIVEQVEGDIIVPDIKPDILSVIKMGSNVYIEKKELQDGKLKIDGTVDVSVIYIADDENNSIRSLNANLNFSEAIEIPEAKSGMFSIIKYDLSNMEYKILNGRKINIKCSLEIDVKIIEKKNIELLKDISTTDGDIQTLSRVMNFTSLFNATSEDISIKENLMLPESNLPIKDILRAEMKIINRDYKVSYNKLLAKSDAKVKIIYIADDGNDTLQTFESIIPLTAFIDIQGINDKMKVEIDYDIENFYVRPIYQEMKAMGIYVESKVQVSARVYENREVTVIEDIYNPNKKIEYKMQNVKINQNMVAIEDKIEISQNVSIPELSNSKLLSIDATPVINEKNFLDEKIIVLGNLELEILYYRIDKKIIETKKIEIPFEKTVNVKNGRDLKNEDINIYLVNVEYDMQSVGQLLLKSELILQINTQDSMDFNLISDVNQTDEDLPKISSIVIYYVKPGDSLWKIAKRYRTTVQEIMANNGLKDDKIYPGQQLIIPRRSCVSKIEALL